jgi:hypothetical protein
MASMSPVAVERNPYDGQGGGNSDTLPTDSNSAPALEIILDGDEYDILDVEDVVPYNHYENLALLLEEEELTEIATAVVDGYESDKNSREEWESTFEKGFDLLGLKLEEATDPFEGACTAVHPLIIESSVKFQSKAIQEIFPAKGPVKTQILGVSTPEKEEQANRVSNFLNYQTTTQMVEYFDELETMLLHLPIIGSAIKKLYFDPNLNRPVSEFVPIDQFVVSNNASSLRNANRYTHLIYRTPNDLKRDITTGFYDLPEGEEELPTPGKMSPTGLRTKLNSISGITSDENEEGYTLLEQHCYLELSIDTNEDEGDMAVALPYTVTVDKDSNKILSIRRNWAESDTTSQEKLCWFTHYKFVPGFGFYGLGYIHLLGNLTATATASMRSLIDAGQFATLPGGFKARGVRVIGEDSPISPGEFREVEATGVDLTKAIIPLPFKEPSQVLMAMLDFVAAAGQKFADTAEQVVAESNNQGPVGTTLALLEASTKFFSAVHKRIHHSQRAEFQILARINADYLPDDGYPYDVPGMEGNVFKSDFDGRVDVLPVSDPNVPSSAHRIAMAQTVLQLSSQAPQGTYDLKKVHKYILGAMNIDAPDKFLAPDIQPQPSDPVTDIHQASVGMPIKAFPGQDHKSHITIKAAFIQDPTLGQNPIMGQVVPVLEANIREHMILAYEEQMAGMLQEGTQKAGSGSPEAISAISQGAAQEILQNNQRAAEEGTVEDLERMSMELQRQRLELDREKLKMDSLQAAAKLALDEDKVDIQRDKLEIDGLSKVASLSSSNSNQEMDRDDKFLLEVFKTLMKETGATVESLKENVDLTPKREEGFAYGGEVTIEDLPPPTRVGGDANPTIAPQLPSGYSPAEEESIQTYEDLEASGMMNNEYRPEEMQPSPEEMQPPPEEMQPPPPSYFDTIVKPLEFDAGQYQDPTKFNEANQTYLVYPDSLGNPTVGAGVLVDNDFKKRVGNNKLKVGDEVPASFVDEEAQRRWSGYVEEAKKVSGFDDDRALPLAEILYQIGPSAKTKFPKAISLYKQGKFAEAADEFSVNGEGTGPSKWMEQTPKRAMEVTGRIRQINKGRP